MYVYGVESWRDELRKRECEAGSASHGREKEEGHERYVS
jgi:hypothetical protein